MMVRPASPPATAPRTALIRAAMAAALALVLFTGAQVTRAAWQDTQAVPVGQIRSGSLGVDLGATTTTVRHTDLTPGAATTTSTQTTTRTLDPGVPAGDLVVGDVLTTVVPVRITATGTNLAATLQADPARATGTAALAAEVDAGTTMTLTPTDGAPTLTPVRGQAHAWSVTAAHDGATYALTVTTRIRPTTDGATRSSAVGTGNWWGAGLQGAAADPRALTVRLTQD